MKISSKLTNYILFLDESGKSKLSDPSDSFLLCGIVIDQDLHFALSNYMVSLKGKSNISAEENIHAYDLFENEKVRDRFLKKGDIEEFFNRFCMLIQGAEIQCWTVRVKKGEFQQMVRKAAKRIGWSEKRVLNYLKQEGLHDFLYEALSRKLILEFGHFLEKQDAVGEVIAESRRWDDHAVLQAFVDSTDSSKFEEGTHYHSWSKYSFRRLHSLVFQNKKGLSFGLEVADLFAWAHFNNHHGLARTYKSSAKEKRIRTRLKRVDEVMKKTLIKDGVEEMTTTKIKSVAEDRVSKFTDILRSAGK